MDYNIPEKANKVLNCIILGLLLILVRVWYLTIIQHEEQLEKARKPKRRVIIEKVERATIRDRFNIPLAINKIQSSMRQSATPISAKFRWQNGRRMGKGRESACRPGRTISKNSRRSLPRCYRWMRKPLRIRSMGKRPYSPIPLFILKEGLTEEGSITALKGWRKIGWGSAPKGLKPLLSSIGKSGIRSWWVIWGRSALKNILPFKRAHHTSNLVFCRAETGEIPSFPKGFKTL